MSSRFLTAACAGALALVGGMFGSVGTAQAGVVETFMPGLLGRVDVIGYDYIHDADTQEGVIGIAVEYDPEFFDNPELVMPMSFRENWAGSLSNAGLWDDGQDFGSFNSANLDFTFANLFSNELPVVVFAIDSLLPDVDEDIGEDQIFGIAPGESSIGEFFLFGELLLASDFVAVCQGGNVCQSGQTVVAQNDVPEPAALVLLGAGLIGVAAARKRPAA